jgi:Flp pilus assembly protein TadD
VKGPALGYDASGPDPDSSAGDPLKHRGGGAGEQANPSNEDETEFRPASKPHDRDSIALGLESTFRASVARQERPMKNRWMGWIGSFAVATVLGTTGASAQQAKMYGAVVDESGVGTPNVKVILVPVERGARVEVVTKGKKGSYLLGIIRPGRYVVKVEATGLALVSIKAEATGLNDYNKKESKWKLDGRVPVDKPTEIEVEDGMEITCDLVVGKASEITNAAGEKTVASGDQAYTLLAKQVQKGDCPGALPGIDKLTVDDPTNAKAFYLKGYCDAVLDHDDEAIVALTKSVELDASFAGAYTLLGKVNARSGKLPEAEAAFKKELEGSAVPPEVQIDALLSLGAVQRDQGKSAEAIATFEKVMTLAPTRPEPYIELSALYAKEGQTDKAAAILDKAKEVGADDPLAMLNVGISYFNKKDYPHAEAMFRRVTESKASNSDLAMAYGLLGKLQLRDGKNADAIASFKKCLELDPTGRLAPETQEVLKAIEPKKK